MFQSFLLVVCVIVALAGPIFDERAEKRLEWFLLGMAALAATIGGSWSYILVVEALLRPLKICIAVLFGSLLISYVNEGLRVVVQRWLGRFDIRLVVAIVIPIVGLLAPVITSVIAALVLVELVSLLPLTDESRKDVAILGASAAGIGGGLTTFGSPVSTVVTARMSELGFEMDSLYLFALMSPWAIPAVFSIGVLAGVLFAKRAEKPTRTEEDPLALWNVVVLVGRTYVMVAALVLLGGAVVGVTRESLISLSPTALYWVNAVSAVVDGATLAAVEISPRLNDTQIRYLLTALLIAGGALITGNATNLLVAHKLGVDSRRWSRVGLPAAGALMLVFYISLKTSIG